MGKLSKAIEDAFYAAVIGNIEILQRCISEGFNVNQADDDGSTPLMLAAVNGQKDAVVFLLKNGADPNKKDVDGWDAAKLAQNAGYPAIAEIIVKNKSGEKVTGMPEGLQEIAIVVFVKEKVEEVRENLKNIKESGGSDERLINETNHLNILLFAEANSFYKHVDREVRSTIAGQLEELNDDFAKASSGMGRPVEKIDVHSIKDYNISRLLNEDEKMLRDITKEIYNSIVAFVSDELSIRPSEFALNYGAYHKRLMKMRDALLDSLRTVGTEGAKGTEKRTNLANIIGAKP